MKTIFPNLFLHSKKIVCSELTYVCFPSIDWETEKVAGRFTISPDNVAHLSLDGKVFEVIYFTTMVKN